MRGLLEEVETVVVGLRTKIKHLNETLINTGDCTRGCFIKGFGTVLKVRSQDFLKLVLIV